MWTRLCLHSLKELLWRVLINLHETLKTFIRSCCSQVRLQLDTVKPHCVKGEYLAWRYQPTGRLRNEGQFYSLKIHRLCESMKGHPASETCCFSFISAHFPSLPLCSVPIQSAARCFPLRMVYQKLCRMFLNITITANGSVRACWQPTWISLPQMPTLPRFFNFWTFFF